MLTTLHSNGGPMTGTPNQIEWANQIKPTVDAEFERVINAFQTLALNQSVTASADTLTILTILREQRSQVLANPSAGYFIAEWRELSDQVRKGIAKDPRHQAIHAKRRKQAALHAI